MYRRETHCFRYAHLSDTLPSTHQLRSTSMMYPCHCHGCISVCGVSERFCFGGRWHGFVPTLTQRTIWVSYNYVIVFLFLQSYQEDLQQIFTNGTWNSPIWKRKSHLPNLHFWAAFGLGHKTFRYELVEETREKLQAAGVEAKRHHDIVA